MTFSPASVSGHPFPTPRLHINNHHLPLSRGSHNEHIHHSIAPRSSFDKGASGGKEPSLRRQALFRLQPNRLLAYGSASQPRLKDGRRLVAREHTGLSAYRQWRAIKGDGIEA